MDDVRFTCEIEKSEPAKGRYAIDVTLRRTDRFPADMAGYIREREACEKGADLNRLRALQALMSGTVRVALYGKKAKKGEEIAEGSINIRELFTASKARVTIYLRRTRGVEYAEFAF